MVCPDNWMKIAPLWHPLACPLLLPAAVPSTFCTVFLGFWATQLLSWISALNFCQQIRAHIRSVDSTVPAWANSPQNSPYAVCTPNTWQSWSSQTLHTMRRKASRRLYAPTKSIEKSTKIFWPTAAAEKPNLLRANWHSFADWSHTHTHDHLFIVDQKMINNEQKMPWDRFAVRTS